MAWNNAAIPIIHGIPGSILGALVGAIITERVYVVPGAGNLLTEAINKYGAHGFEHKNVSQGGHRNDEHNIEGAHLVSLALPSIANLMKWMRRYMIDQMNSDYVKFAPVLRPNLL